MLEKKRKQYTHHVQSNEHNIRDNISIRKTKLQTDCKSNAHTPILSLTRDLLILAEFI